jgi:hypothetical protein
MIIGRQNLLFIFSEQTKKKEFFRQYFYFIEMIIRISIFLKKRQNQTISFVIIETSILLKTHVFSRIFYFYIDLNKDEFTICL